jgi:hypothetical protein
MPSLKPRAMAAAFVLAHAGAAAAAPQTLPSPIPSMHYVSVLPDGTFTPKYLEVRDGDLVRWSGLGRDDSIVHVNTVAGAVNAADACFATNRADPSYANPYRQVFAPVTNEFTGPVRRGLSGIWALGPYGGGDDSLVEIPSVQADAVTPGITAADGCGALDHPESDALLYEDPQNPAQATALVQHRYVLGQFNNGEQGGTIDGNATDRGGAAHVLCQVVTTRCEPDGTGCDTIMPDPAVPETIPPGVYYNGLLHSTYTNPDVTGVVLRFNWKDLQYDANGTVRERWEHLDRELERAIAHGKLVTLDLRAGMFGTPDWIFTDYLVPGSRHAAPWCVNGNCAFVSAHASAGRVEAIEFVDHYDEVPPWRTCGNRIRIGAPGDPDYRALFKDFMARLAVHVASDSRWFQAVAHVKVSGANLRTSEAELPHHCDDQYTNTADHHPDPKASYANDAGDRLLDVFKTLEGEVRTTDECVCNTQIWYDHDYTPQQLYDYYAEVENQILVRFFGRKSLGYDLLHDGFPRADKRPGGSFLGDHLYYEDLQASSVYPGLRVNAGYESEDACTTPTVDAVTGLPRLFENRVNGATDYCSQDAASWPSGGADHLFLAVKPVLPDAGFSSLAAYAEEDDTGGRYPQGSAQSEAIMDQGGNGRFGNPASQTYADRVTGKLFVPQHNGLQVLAQERVDLEYSDQDSQGSCRQQRGRVNIAPAGQPAEYVAGFPILGDDPVSTLATRKGCPNQWIVNQGSDQDVVRFAVQLPPPLPPTEVTIVYPPQLTGYQTSNKVRSLPHVESALFNLVYNTNAVFVELYEDAIWRIGVTRGTGASAAVLDDPADPRRTPNNVCDQHLQAPNSDLCYSKNLHQWSEELHRRRATAATLWANLGGLSYPALADPYPSVYVTKFVNKTTKAQTYSYINPMHCNPALVDLGAPQNGLPSALGTIKVLP